MQQQLLLQQQQLEGHLPDARLCQVTTTTTPPMSHHGTQQVQATVVLPRDLTSFAHPLTVLQESENR